MNRINQQRSETTMVIVDCPWCTEPAVLEADDPAELVCEGCGVRAELAAEPAGHPVALAA